jgi:outer membrane lipoprotein-sorting protein
MVMKNLRTVSTRRLLAIIAGLIAAAVAGTAIAVAAGGTGPVPKRESLAKAVRGALGAPAVNGITARITFTNRLIDASNLQGSDPILSGAKGRLWISADHRFRLELQSDSGTGDAQIVVNNGSFWVYDPGTNTVYQGKLPAGSTTIEKKTGTSTHQLPSIAQIQSDVNKVIQHANLSGAIPGDVAGHAAYTVRVSPQHDAGLLGAGELAWDAYRGVPLRFAVYARGDSSPVLELAATKISYGAVPASDFNVRPPAGAKVVKVSTPAAGADRASKGKAAKHGKHADVSGAAAVAKHLPFKLVAPSKLVGLPRRSVTLLNWGGHPAALVTYGQNLGGMAVIEQVAPAKQSTTTTSGDHHGGLSLPTVSIGGATGQELDTALGTVVRFTSKKVGFTVIGSVPPAAAVAAARGL